jgi:hypothetical protein
MGVRPSGTPIPLWCTSAGGLDVEPDDQTLLEHGMFI